MHYIIPGAESIAPETWILSDVEVGLSMRCLELFGVLDPDVSIEAALGQMQGMPDPEVNY